MTAKWDEEKISSLLSSAFAPGLSKQRAGERPSANIDVLITFDQHGISSHPNHISLYHGARAFVASLMRGRSGWTSPVDLYTLRSINISRKYTSFLDVFATMAMWATVKHKNRDHPGGLVFLSQFTGQGGWPAAWKAMTEAHKSQMVWFRYLWISFSRYMLINDLKLETVKG
jgi:N-acetylglucosaminylphosphatidylinositol deacetylase